MVNNDERREVARILREYTVQDLRYSDPICELVCSSEIDCIGFDSCGGSDMMPECVKLVFDRLADLIEPEPDRTCEMVDNGRELCCSACDWRHDYDDEPVYCSGCGARVVSE